MKKDFIQFDQVVERGAGMDVHKEIIVVTIRGKGIKTQTKSFKLGLCPEQAYHNMITTALWEKSNDKYWQQQMEMDLWIHQILDNL